MTNGASDWEDTDEPDKDFVRKKCPVCMAPDLEVKFAPLLFPDMSPRNWFDCFIFDSNFENTAQNTNRYLQLRGHDRKWPGISIIMAVYRVKSPIDLWKEGVFLHELKPQNHLFLQNHPQKTCGLQDRRFPEGTSIGEARLQLEKLLSLGGTAFSEYH